MSLSDLIKKRSSSIAIAIPAIPAIPVQENSLKIAGIAVATNGNEKITEDEPHHLDEKIEIAINPFTHEASQVGNVYTFKDNRMLCGDCNNLSWQGHCTKWRLTNPNNPKYSSAQDITGRCDHFKNKGLIV